MVGVKDGVHLVGGIDLVLLARNLGRFVVDCLMDLGQEVRCCCCKPSAASKLEGPQVATPIGGAQQGVRVLLEFSVRDGGFGGYLCRRVSKTANASPMTRATLT